MKKIIVIGCPGAGKSTFSRVLRDKTNLPLYYLDMIWHKADKTTLTPEEFDRRLNEILTKDCWIIDGNYRRTLDRRIHACDTVFLFDFQSDVCIQGVRERMGKPREDMPWTEEAEDSQFIDFIKSFSEKEIPKIYSLLNVYKDKNIIVFKDRAQLEAYIRRL